MLHDGHRTGKYCEDFCSRGTHVGRTDHRRIRETCVTTAPARDLLAQRIGIATTATTPISFDRGPGCDRREENDFTDWTRPVAPPSDGTLPTWTAGACNCESMRTRHVLARLGTMAKGNCDIKRCLLTLVVHNGTRPQRVISERHGERQHEYTRDREIALNRERLADEDCCNRRPEGFLGSQVVDSLRRRGLRSTLSDDTTATCVSQTWHNPGSWTPTQSSVPEGEHRPGI